MKRNSFFLVIIILLSMVFISCSAEPASSYDSEVAKVGVSVSKALTSSTTTTTLPDIDDLYVFYTAYKISGGFRTGETTGITPIRTDNDGKGLPQLIGQTRATFGPDGPVVESDTWFSTGTWLFSFYASTTPTYKASNVIFRADDVVVEITRPQDESQNIGGTAVIQLVVDENNDPRENASVFVNNIYVDFGNSFDASATYKMSVYLDDVTTTAIATIEGTNDTSVDGRVTFTSTGAVKSFSETEGASHMFDFKVTKGEDPMVFAEGSITVSTAKGQVTTITGDLSSLDSLAMIAINLDESVDVVNGTVTKVKEINNITSGYVVVTSNIAPDMTKESNKTTVTFNSEDLSSSTSFSLEVKVTTAAIGENSEAFEVISVNGNETESSIAEIDLALKKTTINSDTTIDTQYITYFPNKVHVETFIEPNLSDVKVYYKDSNGGLHNVSAEYDEYGDVTYDPDSGRVSFYTNHFSKYIVSTNTSELCIMNEFTGKKYKSFQFALSEATDGARFILLGHMSLTEPVTVTNDVNLNLNGFDITATDSRAIWVKSGELTVTGSGTIKSDKSDNGNFASSSSVIRVGSSESQDGSAGLVIDKNVTISSNHCYGVTVFGKNTEGQTLDVKGTVSVTGEASAISGNGSEELTNTEITIRDGANVSSTGDVAIYHPQEGTLNIEGGVITGKGGVEVKGGTVIISGGTITANAEASHVANNNDPSTTGYAVVAVENNRYKGKATIEITGGTFTGAIGVEKDSESEAFDATLSIGGGYFSVDPTTYVLPSYSVIHDEKTGMYEVTTDSSRNIPLTLEAFSDTVTITIKNAPESLTCTYVNAEGYTEAYDEATATYTISLPVGEKLELRANGTGSTGHEHFLNITGSADFYCYGNVMSLVDSVNYRKLTEIPHDYEFYGLFAYNLSLQYDGSIRTGYSYHLVNHPDHNLLLPATTLSAHCYDSMFAGCGKMERAPELSATTLKEGCYKHMFFECFKLTATPVLPATTMVDSCYYGMFDNSFLKTAPELPATTLADHCYQYMFRYCSFKEAPALPATTLAPYCYAYMFCDCSSLTNAPALPATTLADHCYEYMFSHCGSLQTAPALPATTLAPYCYHDMFYYCYKLANAPELKATVMAPYCYSAMFYECEALTSAPALPATTLAKGCYSSMFSWCKKLATAPAELPATTLAPYCYSYMFYKCTSLTATPVLPAETLVDNCYYHMFADCSNLTTVTCLALRNVRYDSDGNWTTPSWLENVSSTGTIYINPNAIVIVYGSDDYWNRATRAAATWIKDDYLDDWDIPKGWTIYTH